MQNAQIIGNLVADAAVRTARDESEYLVFTVAVNESRAEEKRTQYFDVFYNKTAIKKYLLKGQKVFVSGHLSAAISSKDDKSYINLAISAREVELIQKEQN